MALPAALLPGSPTVAGACQGLTSSVLARALRFSGSVRRRVLCHGLPSPSPARHWHAPAPGRPGAAAVRLPGRLSDSARRRETCRPSGCHRPGPGLRQCPTPGPGVRVATLTSQRFRLGRRVRQCRASPGWPARLARARRGLPQVGRPPRRKPA
jgi:hypothetical protein